MAKSKSAKVQLLSQYKDMLANNAGYILVDTEGIDTATITKFKMDLQDVNAEYRIVKNTVFKIALNEAGTDVSAQNFDGQTAVIVYNQEPTAAAKLLKKLREDIKAEGNLLMPRSGTLNGEVITSEQVIALAEIPSREILLAKLLGSLNAPLSGLMNAMTGNVRGFTMVLKQLSEK